MLSHGYQRRQITIVEMLIVRFVPDLPIFHASRRASYYRTDEVVPGLHAGGRISGTLTAVRPIGHPPECVDNFHVVLLRKGHPAIECAPVVNALRGVDLMPVDAAVPK